MRHIMSAHLICALLPKIALISLITQISFNKVYIYVINSIDYTYVMRERENLFLLITLLKYCVY